MTGQLSMFGARSGVEKFRPYAVGDVLVKKSGLRVVVTALEPDAYAEPALICTRLDTGAEGLVAFEGEIAWRST